MEDEMKSRWIRFAGGVLASTYCSMALAIFAADPRFHVQSLFDSNDEGWTVVDIDTAAGFNTIVGGPSAPQYFSTGGNPGGYIEAQDPSAHSFYFNAPAKFLGDKSNFFGSGSIVYEVRSRPATPAWTADPDVVLVSGDTVLVYDILITNPGTQFNHVVPVPFSLCSVFCEGSGWLLGSLSGARATQEQLQSVLGNLTALMIRAEYVASDVNDPLSFELVGLDNVQMVPEPATALLMSLGIVGVLLATRRRDRNRAES